MQKTFRTIKLVQIGKWHRATTEEERAAIECNPVVLLKQAIKNTTPIVRKYPNFIMKKIDEIGTIASHISSTRVIFIL